MVRIDNLSKNYGTVQAVDSISFSLGESEIVGFLGANGAGKSTTLKMITGYLTLRRECVSRRNEHYRQLSRNSKNDWLFT